MNKRFRPAVCIVVAMLLFGCSGPAASPAVIATVPPITPEATAAHTQPPTPSPTAEPTPSLSPAPLPTPVKTALPDGLAALGQYTTSTKNASPDYRKNMALAAAQLDGLMLPAGAKLSFRNQVMKGVPTFMRVSSGLPLSQQHVAPGLLQTVSTLYDTALLSGLEILERHQCAQPPVYTLKGLDAFVDLEGTMDFAIRNQYCFPVWISASADVKKARLAIVIQCRGSDLPAKRPVKLRSELLETLPAPPQTLVEDISLKKGKRIDLPSRPGIRVKVIREWLDAATGKHSDELLYEARYEPIAGQLRYAPGDKPKR